MKKTILEPWDQNSLTETMGPEISSDLGIRTIEPKCGACKNHRTKKRCSNYGIRNQPRPWDQNNRTKIRCSNNGIKNHRTKNRCSNHRTTNQRRSWDQNHRIKIRCSNHRIKNHNVGQKVGAKTMGPDL